jgi:hypothetical protein
MFKVFIYFWIFSLMTFTVIASFTLSTRNKVVVALEEEERPVSNNLLEELHKAVSLTENISLKNDLIKINNRVKSVMHTCKLLKDTLYLKSCDIPPEVLS